jgi:DNA replication and repair protein RecF
MLVVALEARGFRNLDHVELALTDGVTVIHGANGAGKTNLLEALSLGLTGSSWRTRTERELIAFGGEIARAEVTVADEGESRTFVASVSRGDGRRQRLNGKPVGPDSVALRPAVALFSPDRLTLIKGPPGERRRHIDSFLGAVWPARAELRRRYGRALAQRNALLARIRAGAASEDALAAWDAELAGEAAELVEARREAIDLLAPSFAELGSALGLPGDATLGYRPRTGLAGVDEIAEQLRQRRGGDLDRGYSTHGPHLDEVEIALDGRALRRYGSQGEQRSALLALLFAERAALLEVRRTPPLMLLDDVTSELDSDRRELLVGLLQGGGQALITATEPSAVPEGGPRAEVGIEAGGLRAVPLAA